MFEFPSFTLVNKFEDKYYVQENWPPLKIVNNDTLLFKYNYSTMAIESYSLPDL